MKLPQLIQKSMSCWGERKMAEKVKIGVVPIRRSFLSMDEAVKQKQRFMKVIREIRPDASALIDIDDICENGILWDAHKVDEVVSKMKANGATALFLAFCDFGEEVVTARVAAALKLPVLVWGARDERVNSDESRGRDTQCGMFAATKVLARMGVTYSYIYNVAPETAEFRFGFETFIRTMAVVQSLRGLKIAQIGQRPSSFMSVVASEGALMENFGIEVLPLQVHTILRRMDEIKKHALHRDVLEQLKAKVDTSKMADAKVENMAAFKIALRDSLDQLGCRGAAFECWSAFPLEIGFTPCFMLGELIDEGYPISCETDLNGAVTSVMLQAASLGDSSPFFADLTVRHPENDNAELLWHCGPFPYSLRDPACSPYLVEGRGRFLLMKKGDITIARLDDIHGQYQFVAVEGRSVEGPATTGTYTYFETENWKRVEEKFIFGPYIHHVAGCHGKYAHCLKEAIRYLPAIKWDDLNCGPVSL